MKKQKGERKEQRYSAPVGSIIPAKEARLHTHSQQSRMTSQSRNVFDFCLNKDIYVKPESKSPILCPNRPQILTLSSDQV